MYSSRAAVGSGFWAGLLQGGPGLCRGRTREPFSPRHAPTLLCASLCPSSPQHTAIPRFPQSSPSSRHRRHTAAAATSVVRRESDPRRHCMLAALLEGIIVLLASMLQRSLLISRTGSLWHSYCEQLRRRPLLTKAATGVVGSIIGDGIAQYTSTRAAPRSSRPAASGGYDVGRAGRLCLYAALIGTPIGHYWFQFLDRNIFPHALSHPLTAVVKTLLDQAVMAPAGIALFFVAMGVFEGRPLREAAATARDKFRPTLVANYALWPAANLINFAFVPPAQRILYCNVIYVFWASFLSAMASKKVGPSAVGPDLAQKEL